ncbi:Hypothetical protein POVN_LOCUS77 [uncultured virus]|nr:Hypothetical protein POVN_LOCUS77 [uncultured virus]
MTTPGVDIFLELAERIKALKAFNSHAEAKQLHNWLIEQKGMLTLVEDMGTFLRAQLKEPEKKDPKLLIRKRLDNRFENVQALLAWRDAGFEKENLKDMSVEQFGSFLAGLGVTPTDIEAMKPSQLLQLFQKLEKDPMHMGYDDYARFVYGLTQHLWKPEADLDETTIALIQQRVANYKALSKGLLRPSPNSTEQRIHGTDEEDQTEKAEHAAFYFAGAGITPTDLETSSIAQWHRENAVAGYLMVDGDAENAENFINAFLRYT